jgi:hypothetical protein
MKVYRIGFVLLFVTASLVWSADKSPPSASPLHIILEQLEAFPPNNLVMFAMAGILLFIGGRRKKV